MAKADVAGDVILVLPEAREVYLLSADGEPQLPGVRYHVRPDSHHDKDHFVMPLTWASCVALRGAFGDLLEIGPALNEWARNELSTRVVPAMQLRNMHLKLDDNRIEAPLLDPRLWEPQKVGAAFMARAGDAILGDDPGTGKTAQTIAALRLIHDLGGRALPALHVVPNSTKRAWKRQYAKWWPEARVSIVSGNARKRRDAIALVTNGEADVAVIGWEALRLHTKIASWGSAVRVEPKEKLPKELNEIEWAVVVADEAHRAINPRSKQTRALWAVSANAVHKYALTGTPADKTEEIWSIGHFIAPKEYPGKTAFLTRYAHTTFNPWGGFEVIGLNPVTSGEYFQFLDPRFLRRTKREVMPWLPDEPMWDTREVEMTPKQTRAYKNMEKEMIALLDDGAVTATTPLVKMLRLRQFAAAYATIEPCPTCGGADDECRRCKGMGTVVELSEPSSKIDGLEDVADEMRGEPALVFAESAQLIRLAGARLEKRGYEVGYIDGDHADEEYRDQTVQGFARGDLQFVLATFAAGGEGIDGLQTRCSTGVFLQRSYRRRFQVQAEGRLDRGGQESRVRFIDIITSGTAEQRVFDVLGHKADVAEEINRDRLREILTEGAA
jgi:SNF2 family DNA or RNA helicase